MNQYAFNVFLEKSRKNDVNEVAALGSALRVVGKSALGAGKLAAKSAVQGIKKDVTKSAVRAGAVASKEYGVNKNVVRDILKGKNLGASIRAAAVQGAPAVGRKLQQKASDFVKTGGFSGQFTRQAAQRGAGPQTTYQSALGSLGGGASYQASKMETDPLYGLDPVERRRALMQMGPR
jgi:hypothetical protein